MSFGSLNTAVSLRKPLSPAELRPLDDESSGIIARPSLDADRASRVLPAHPRVDQGAAVKVGRVLPLGLAALDEVLPDGGLPRGAVVELASPHGLARATSIALAACSAAQAEAKLRGGAAAAGAWCAWIDPTLSLFAPAVTRAGVDLDRLLVVQPPEEDLARIAAKVASSGVFSVIVVDLAGVPGLRSTQRLDRWVNTVRRLALAVEGTETSLVLLTDVHAPRAMPLPVALRLEIDRAAQDRLIVRVAKDRRGRIGPPATLPLAALDRNAAPEPSAAPVNDTSPPLAAGDRKRESA